MFSWQLADRKHVLHQEDDRLIATLGQRGDQFVLSMTDLERTTSGGLWEEFSGAATGSLAMGLRWWDLLTSQLDWLSESAAVGRSYLTDPTYSPSPKLDDCVAVSVEVDGTPHLGLGVLDAGGMAVISTVARACWLVACTPANQFDVRDLKFAFVA